MCPMITITGRAYQNDGFLGPTPRANKSQATGDLDEYFQCFMIK